MIEFFVAGIPQPKGSTRAFVPKGWTRPIVTTDNKATKPWEQAIRAEADLARRGAFLVLAAAVTATFVLRRPKSHYRVDGSLKPSAPMRHTTKPDGDKLARSLLDALTGVILRDDAQVDDLRAKKRYVAPGEQPGVYVAIEPEVLTVHVVPVEPKQGG